MSAGSRGCRAALDEPGVGLAGLYGARRLQTRRALRRPHDRPRAGRHE